MMNFRFQEALRHPDAKKNMDLFLANGGQTRAGELDLQVKFYSKRWGFCIQNDGFLH